MSESQYKQYKGIPAGPIRSSDPASGIGAAGMMGETSGDGLEWLSGDDRSGGEEEYDAGGLDFGA